jgi:hypothetical protein
MGCPALDDGSVGQPLGARRRQRCGDAHGARSRGIDPDVIERAMMPKFLTDQRPVIDGEAEDDAKPN